MKVICFGNDATLLETRLLLLRSAGFDARSMEPRHASTTFEQENSGLAVLLCHTLSPGESASIRDLAAGKAKVVHLDRLIGPENLLRMVAGLGRHSFGEIESSTLDP